MNFDLQTLHELAGPGWSNLITQVLTDLLNADWKGDFAKISVYRGGLVLETKTDYKNPKWMMHHLRLQELEKASRFICRECGQGKDPDEYAECDECMVAGPFGVDAQ